MSEEKAQKIAVVRIRGITGIKKDIKDTLSMLKLYKKNYCVLVNKTENMLGMLKKAKDYITWGEVDPETIDQLFEKKGAVLKSRETDKKEKITYKFVEHNSKKYKPFFRLNPPKKGYGRKGIKKPFSTGGALGYRASDIKDLILRML